MWSSSVISQFPSKGGEAGGVSSIAEGAVVAVVVSAPMAIEIKK